MPITLNHKGKIKIGKVPGKKTLKLQGKTVYDKYSSNEGKTVWEPIVYWKRGLKIIRYNMKKCDKEKCNGTIIYNKNGFKICNKCGLFAHAQSNIISNIIKQDNKTNNIEDIKYRNRMWDILEINKLNYFTDKGYQELNDRYMRIKEYENTKNKKRTSEKY